LSKKQPAENDTRQIYFMKASRYADYIFTSSSVKKFSSYILSLLPSLPDGYAGLSHLSAALHGLISQVMRPVRLPQTNIIMYQVGKHAEKQFLTTGIQLKASDESLSNMLTRKLNIQQPAITVHKLALTITNQDNNDSSSTVCKPFLKLSGYKYVCTQENKYSNNNEGEVNHLATANKCSNLMFNESINFPSLASPFTDQKRVIKMHKYILYGLVGQNVKKVATNTFKQLVSNRSLIGFTNLDIDACSDDRIKTSSINVINQTVVPDFSDLQNQIICNLKEIHEKYNRKQNFTIIPVDDGLYTALMDSKPNTVLTFSINGTKNVKGSCHNKNLIFLSGSGTMAIKNGNDDDIIFFDKSSQLNGVIDAKNGNDTLILIGGHHQEIMVTVESNGDVLTVKPKTGSTELTLLNVEHLVGAPNSYDELYLRCGLESVNLRGGTETKKDHIVVDISPNCSSKTLIVLEKFTVVHHLTSNKNVNYKFIVGPVLMQIDADDSKPVMKDIMVVAAHYNIAEIHNILVYPLVYEYLTNSRLSINFVDSTNNSHLLVIHNFYDESVKVTFTDGFQLYSRYGQFYIGSDCSLTDQEKVYQLNNHLYKLLYEQGIIFTIKCSPTTFVYTGKVGNENHIDLVLPTEYVKYENDPNAALTHFKTQHSSETTGGVYHLDGPCRPGGLQCTTINATVEVTGETVLDLRDVTRGFEDSGYLVNVQVNPSDETLSLLKLKHKVVRVLATITGKPQLLLAYVTLVKSQEMLAKTSVLTSRHRHTVQENGQVNSEYLAPPDTHQMVVVEYDSRLKLLERDSGCRPDTSKYQRHNGDTIVSDHKCSTSDSTKIITAFFLNRWPQCASPESD